MARAEAVKRRSSFGIGSVLLLGPTDVVAFEMLTGDLVSITDDRTIPRAHVVSLGRNLSIQQDANCDRPFPCETSESKAKPDG